MIAVAAPIALVLALLAGLHVYWACGGVWPGVDQRSCARAVAGFRGIDRMPPPAMSLAVALALALAGLLALMLAAIVPAPVPAMATVAAGACAAVVFIGRGLAGFSPGWRRLTPEMPFARNDVRYFSPLCLLVGAGFVLLSLQGANP